MSKIYDYLDKINLPNDIKKFGDHEMKFVADDVRDFLIQSVSKTGGHLGAGLGVVELTVALAYCFDLEKDKVIWDVSHQSYPYKIITGRKDKLETIRQEDGLSGFCKRSESEYDIFGAGHSSTSISASLGIAQANEFNGKNDYSISVIGDGAMSAGMAIEALNNSGNMNSNFITILNDNDMSISGPVGGLSNYFSKLVSSRGWISARKFAKNISSKFPKPIYRFVAKAEEYFKGLITGNTFFEELGFYYIGLVDGHDIDGLITIFNNIKNNKIDKPILIHLKTEKGKGFSFAENSIDKYHGVSKFCVLTGKQEKSKGNKTYTEVFSECLIHHANNDDKIVAITAAMDTGTGLDKFAKIHKNKMFDVGIAEQHAVTFAAGLATENFKPFVAIYSTFLQRGYDQIIHDVAIQNLPVRFAIDRAGHVGADGATHAGTFDIAYLGNIPNMVCMAASDEEELAKMVATSVSIDDRPSSFRYPRGEGVQVDYDIDAKPLEIGVSKLVQSGEKIAVISYGSCLQNVKIACNEFSNKHGVDLTIIDARFAKPIDKNMIKKMCSSHDAILTVEEGCIGGFGAFVNDYVLNELNDNKIVLRNCFFSDEFVNHASQQKQNQISGVDENGIYEKLEVIFETI